MPALTGTGRIADELYLLAHDDVTGRSFLQSRALGIGLAGSLLAELMFTGAIWVTAEELSFPYHGLPHDGLGQHVLSLLEAERERYPLRDWLLFLGGNAAENVARRLERAGYLAEANSRLPWRGHRWVPANSDCAFAPLIRVKAVMEHRRPLPVADVVLSGLAVACGLGPRVLPLGPPDARDAVEAVVRTLPVGQRELIARTQATVDSALLSHRV